MGCPSHSRCDTPSGESEHVTLNLGILIALACAVATQLGFLYKHRGACAAAKVDIRRPLKTVRSLFGSRWFAIGMAVALGAWLLHVAAMALAPISVVQAVLSTGVVVLAVMAERLFGFKVGRRQWLGVAMTAAGLVLLVITLPAQSGSHSSFSVAGMISFEAGVLAPWLLVTIVASVVAFYASARGLQDGEAVPVIASTSTAANVSTILGGIVVFGDPMPGDTLGIALQMFAFALVVVAALIVPPPLRAAEATARTA